MTIGKRERMLTGVLVASLTALLGDRLLLPDGGPRAALGDAATDDTTAGSGVVPMLPLLAASQPSIPVSVADVFHWSRLGDAAAAMTAAAVPASVPDAAVNQFETTHELRAIILGPRPAALVGEALLHVGDQVDGFTLRGIRASEAEFLSDHGLATLRLPTAGRRP